MSLSALWELCSNPQCVALWHVCSSFPVQGIVCTRLTWWKSLNTWATVGSLKCSSPTLKRFHSCLAIYPRPRGIHLGWGTNTAWIPHIEEPRWLRAGVAWGRAWGIHELRWCWKTVLADLPKNDKIWNSKMVSWVIDTRISMWQESGSPKILMPGI